MVNEDCIDLSIFDDNMVYGDDLYEQYMDDMDNLRGFIEVMKEIKNNDIESPVLW